ncbi:uncharacterized protein LOC119167773 isoform X1 [Rhipicephalus microplus]|uniref:uncharacterized protein LOC119167773 isoform X1 n=1 Tax=Rhipicephalus microplus TaxID=6941 RepID=UPI003F6C648E
MAILSRCCFVCSVRDGTLIIGITCIVCRVLASIACVVLLASYAQENNAEQGGTVRYNLTSLKLLLPDNLLVMLFSGLLVIGLVKNRRYYLIPWIVWVSASCIILIILWCLRAIIAIKDQVFAACNEPVRYQETNVDTSTLIYGLHSQVNATALYDRDIFQTGSDATNFGPCVATKPRSNIVITRANWHRPSNIFHQWAGD